MQRIHTIHEDYDHYNERKKKEAIMAAKWLVPLVIGVFGFFLLEVGRSIGKPGGGLLLILISVIWFGISIYLSFNR